MAWKYDLIESHDLEIINDPQGTIFNTGGCISLAKSGDEIVGSAALINEGDGFKHIDATDSPFATADVKMELSVVQWWIHWRSLFLAPRQNIRTD